MPSDPESAGIEVGAAPVKRKKAKRSNTKQASESCGITQADGARMSVEIGDGRVNCSGAEALWNERVLLSHRRRLSDLRWPRAAGPRMR